MYKAEGSFFFLWLMVSDAFEERRKGKRREEKEGRWKGGKGGRVFLFFFLSLFSLFRHSFSRLGFFCLFSFFLVE